MLTRPFSAFVAIEDPPLGGCEQHQSDQHDHNKDDPGNGAGVTHLEVGEAFLIQFHAQHIGSLHGAAIGDDKGRGEVLQSLNGLHDKVEEEIYGRYGHRN